MSVLLTKLIDLFKIDKINFLTANRKTLDEFLSKTEFQKRRQALFEAACARGKKKSRVALCKSKKRPLFAQELSTIATKPLRAMILLFLQDLGLDNLAKLKNKNEKQLQKFAEEKNWEQVIFMSNNSVAEVFEKKTGAGRGVKAENIDDDIDVPDDARRYDWMSKLDQDQVARLDAQAQRVDEKPRPQQRRRVRRRPRRSLSIGRSIGLTKKRTPAKRRKRGPQVGTMYMKRAKVITGRDAEGQLQYERQKYGKGTHR